MTENLLAGDAACSDFLCAYADHGDEFIPSVRMESYTKGQQVLFPGFGLRSDSDEEDEERCHQRTKRRAW